MTNRQIKILMAASECAPLAKVGGLGDVVGSLPQALAESGCQAAVILPWYGSMRLPDRPVKLPQQLNVPFKTDNREVSVHKTTLPGGQATAYLLRDDEIFGGGVYDDPAAGPGGPGETEKFLFYCRCVAEFLKQTIWPADLLHLHDWHAAALAALAPALGIRLPALVTIHNLAMQGKASSQSLQTAAPELLGLTEVQKEIAETGTVNLLRLGISWASAITTVSPSYAQEILTEEYGEGLHAALANRRVFGILNGIDVRSWNPETDRTIAKTYSRDNPEGKLANKTSLQRELGWEMSPSRPLIGAVSRLTKQKGFDLLREAAVAIRDSGAQLVALGVGDPETEAVFAELANAYPDNFRLKKGFDESLARRIYAGSDLFLMPSRFEPCGLGQMIAMRYGSLPLVRLTGGLKDSVTRLADDRSNLGTANGFGFGNAEPEELAAELKRSLSMYRTAAVDWIALRKNAMEKDFSWKNSALAYRQAYDRLLQKDL